MYKRIMVIVEPGPATPAAVAQALRLASPDEGELTFVAVVPRYPAHISEPVMINATSEREFELAARAGADDLIAAAVAMSERAGVMSRGLSVPADDAVGHIVEAARRRRCELIVIAADGHNALVRLVTGSLVPALITHAPAPVLVCKATDATGSGALPPTTSRPRSRTRRRAPAGLSH